MAVETRMGPENRPDYTWLVQNAAEGSLDYYIPATLRRNFSFPIGFKKGAVDPDGKIPDPSSCYAVMTDGSITASRIEEIKELVKVNSGVGIIDTALRGKIADLYNLATNVFKEEHLKVEALKFRPPMASSDIYRAFLLAYDRRYRSFEGGRGGKLAQVTIEHDAMRHFYNSLRAEYEMEPMDQERIIIIISAAVKNVLDVMPHLNASIQIRQAS